MAEAFSFDRRDDEHFRRAYLEGLRRFAEANRRRATRPATFPDDAPERRKAYEEWTKSAHLRGNQIEHNEGCLCTTCRAATYGKDHV